MSLLYIYISMVCVKVCFVLFFFFLHLSFWGRKKKKMRNFKKINHGLDELRVPKSELPLHPVTPSLCFFLMFRKNNKRNNETTQKMNATYGQNSKKL